MTLRISRSLSAALWCAIALPSASCAIGVTNDPAASVGDPVEGDEPEEEDAELPEEEDADAQPALDAGTPGPSAPDASADGGGVDAEDAGSDAGSSGGTLDAGGGALDAGRDAGAANDAGRDSGSGGTTDSGTTDSGTVDSGTGGGGGMCNPDSCTNDCSIAGPFRCCERGGGCGCSWFPIAYCN